VRVIARPILRGFIAEHPDAATSLDAWWHEARRADWTTPNEVRESFASASFVEGLTVFNIAGNKYRLIVDIRYDLGRVYIADVLTHRDYDRGLWKP